MDLVKFKERYPVFLNLMKEKGYHGGYIEKFERIIKLILEEGGDESIGTYEQFYHYMVAHHTYTERTCYGYRNQIGRLKVYVEDGIFLGDTGKSSGFLRFKSYDYLLPDFKCLIDRYVDIEQKRGKRSESAIKSIVSHVSSFFYCIQQAGVTTLASIKNAETVLQAFDSNQRRHGSPTVSESIAIVLKACMPLYPNGECRDIWGMLPRFARKNRLYDYLQVEESKKVVSVLDDDEGNLSYRSKAIGKLAYYTGMRRTDIANLRFENVSFEKEEITFVQQKTGLEVCIPLRSVVGNAIYDYIVNERPKHKCDSDHIFITAVTPVIKLSPSGVSNDSAKIFKAADIRREKGRKRGFHLFRHAFASDLVAKDIPFHVVSELLGHVSIESLNPYLDADIEHLRACALSIAPFSQTLNAYMEPFCSPVREIIRKYIEQCTGQGIWRSDHNRALRSFDNYCITSYPNTLSLSQEMINLWCKPVSGESRKAYLKRIDAFSDFVRYISDTYNPAIVMPEPDSVARQKKSPLTKEFTGICAELFNRFVSHRKASGCWSAPYEWALRSFDMHCTTMYPESSALTQEMVDTWYAVRPSENLHSCGKRVAVVKSFLQYIEHRVALHPAMKEQLVVYDGAVSKLLPDRKCFFPDYYDKYYSLAWMENHFEKLWFKYNHNHATSYHLRHHYATTNINNWPSQAEKFNRNLLYLSRSMGHSTIETTMYYYSFTPKLAELLKKRKSDTFNGIIPDRNHYFKDEDDENQETCFNRDIIEDWLTWLSNERNNGKTTRDHRLAIVKSLLKYLKSKDRSFTGNYLDACEIRSISHGRGKKVEGLSKNAMKAFFAAIDCTTRTGKRDYTLFAFMYDTGCRIGEELNIKLKDLYMDVKNPYVIVDGKGNKQRPLILSEKTVETISLYKKMFFGNKPNPESYLFYSNHGGIFKQMSEDAINDRLYIIAEKANKNCPEVPLHMHCHQIRHSAASHWLQDDINIAQISRYLGHESLETTRKYLGISREELEQALAKREDLIDDQKKKYKDVKGGLKSLIGRK